MSLRKIEVNGETLSENEIREFLDGMFVTLSQQLGLKSWDVSPGWEARYDNVVTLLFECVKEWAEFDPERKAVQAPAVLPSPEGQTCGRCTKAIDPKDPWNCPEADHGYFCGTTCVDAHLDTIHAMKRRA